MMASGIKVEERKPEKVTEKTESQTWVWVNYTRNKLHL